MRPASPIFRAAELFRLALDNTGDAIFIDDRDGRLIYANNAFFALYGFDPGTPLDKIRLEDYVCEEDKLRLRDRHNRRIQGESVPDIFEYRGRRTDDTRLLLEVRVTPVQHKGRVIGTHSVVRDITQRRRMEDHERQTQKMESVGRLAAGIAHDFNNILQGILGHAALAKEELTDGTYSPQGLSEHLEAVVGASRRAADLIRQLLGFARKGQYNPVDLNINSVISEAIVLLESGLRTSTPCEIVPDLMARNHVHADATQIHQVIQNLMINARDAMPASGRIVVSTRDLETNGIAGRIEAVPEGSYVSIQVRDTGPGIPSDVCDRMFEPFFTTKGGSNSGLGLSTVFGIVKRHGGFVDVESSPKGTTFTIHLPSVPPVAAIQVRENLEREGRGRVLIVDDEHAVCRVAEMYLSGRGFDVVSAFNGKEALDRFRGGGVDLVLTDLIMSPMSGSELFDKIRELDPKAKVAIMSGYLEDQMVQELLARGAIGFLQKPFDLSQLAGKISDWSS